ncbi:MAG: serine hydrolase domain-containing protein [Pseudomonadota bacterium]
MSYDEAAKIHSAFEAAGSKTRPFALAAAFARGQDAPEISVSGPINRRSAEPVGLNAKWHIGSISKSFTSALVMQCVERGQLDLDAAVGDVLGPYARELHRDWANATLRQLLSHSAGLAGGVPISKLRAPNAASAAEARISVLRKLWTAPTPGRPGKFKYSNFGYMFAGVVLEQAMGKAWEDLVFESLTRPLGLGSAGLYAPTSDGDPWGHHGYVFSKRPVSPDHPKSDLPWAVGPAGLLHMSLADLIKWGQINLSTAKGGQFANFLSPESCRAMQSPVADSYGLGWIAEPARRGNPAIVWHNGSNLLWTVILMMVPEQNLTLAVATNRFAVFRINALARKLLAALM